MLYLNRSKFEDKSTKEGLKKFKTFRIKDNPHKKNEEFKRKKTIRRSTLKVSEISSSNIEENRVSLNWNDESKNNNNENEDKSLTGGDYTICVLLFIVGIPFQPLYLCFYFLWATMWIIREYGWWCCFFSSYGF